MSPCKIPHTGQPKRSDSLAILPAIVFLTLIAAGVLLLQIFLSSMESRLPGLILPFAALLLSFLSPLNAAQTAGGVTAGLALRMAVAWLTANIPTAILLAVFFACKAKKRRP